MHFMTTCCAFCGRKGGLTNEDVLPRWLLKAIEDASVSGTVPYRQSRDCAVDSPEVHSRHGRSGPQPKGASQPLRGHDVDEIGPPTRARQQRRP